MTEFGMVADERGAWQFIDETWNGLDVMCDVGDLPPPGEVECCRNCARLRARGGVTPVGVALWHVTGHEQRTHVVRRWPS